MKTNLLLVGAFALLVGCTATAKTNEYVVIAGKSVVEDSLWNQVAQALVEKHGAASLSYDESLEELLPQLRELRPRYVAIVEKPENLGRDYVIALNQMSRRVDNDIYADFLWGIITGYDAAAAMKMVDNSTEPLVMKDAVATITELSSGKWFDRFAWIDDHKMGLWGEKKSKDDTIVTNQLPMKKMRLQYTFSHGDTRTVERTMVDPKDEMQTFYDLYARYNPDLVVTAAHATERNLEMPFSLGNIRPRNGVLYMDFPDGPKDLVESGKRKVYLPIGNCLIANVDNTKEPTEDEEPQQSATITVLASPEQARIITEMENDGVAHVALISRNNDQLAEELLVEQDKTLQEIYFPETLVEENAESQDGGEAAEGAADGESTGETGSDGAEGGTETTPADSIPEDGE